MPSEKIKKREDMQRQTPEKRIHNFDEVALGYTKEQAISEASRCLQCKKATCVKGCPVEVDIPGFIKQIQEGNFEASIKVLKEKNNLPAVCGRVCPQETQCEQLCVLAKKYGSVAIGRLERFAADEQIKNSIKYQVSSVKQTQNSKLTTYNGIKVAVVGSGPAGLTCAADLAKMGYAVTIFESLHDTGGVLRYGIPEFRMPKHILDIEVGYIRSLGVDIKLNVLAGQAITIDELFKQGYKAIFIGAGAGLPSFMGIKGENLNGVYSANEFLTRVNLMKAYKNDHDTPVKAGRRVAVIGAGNVSMDCARVAKRLGAEKSMIVYRRSASEAPARKEEIENAQEEGIEFHFLTLPVEIIEGDVRGWAGKLKCVKMELGEPDESGRRRPVPIKGSEFFMDVDTVIVAIGQSPNPLLINSTPGLKKGKHGNIITDPVTGQTSMEGVYAGGDIATGAATVIEAMGAGKRAARAMDEYIKNRP